VLASLLRKVKNRQAKVCIIGLGRVGLPLAVVLADNGINVLGLDADEKRTSKIASGRAPFRENMLDGYLAAAISQGKFTVAQSIESARSCDLFIVAVGTPVTERLNVEDSQLIDAISELSRLDLRDKGIAIRSTTAPGTLVNLVRPLIEEKTGLHAGRDFALAACPERILEGRAMEELQTLPEIIGGIDDTSGSIFSELFMSISPQKEVISCRPIEAELAKLFTNTYRYVNFALSNELAIIAEKYGADAHRVIQIANHGYPRSNIPEPGLSGGPCLGKDGFLLDSGRHDNSIVYNAWLLNESVPSYILSQLERKLGRLKGRRISVLGLAFKAGSDDIRLSPAARLVDLLREHGAVVTVHDPNIKSTSGMSEAMKRPEAIIVAMNHAQFRTEARTLDESGARIVYDVWGLYEERRFKHAEYVRFGSGA
jgi:UDP-N-acetyl-D-mannosaminuronic acid dehydrogenase